MAIDNPPIWRTALSFDPAPKIQPNLIDPIKSTLTQLDTAIQNQKTGKEGVLNRADLWIQGVKASTISIADTAKPIQNIVGDFVLDSLSTGAKFLLIPPINGNMDSVKERVIETLSGNIPNFPNFSKDSTVGGAILVCTAGNLVESIIKWTALSILLFGPTVVGMEAINQATQTPLLGPLADTAKKDASFLSNSLLQGEFADDAIAGLATDDFNTIKDSWISSTFMQLATGKTNPLSVAFGAVGEAIGDEISNVDRAFSNTEEADADLGQAIGDTISTIVGAGPSGDRLIDKFEDNPYDTWYDVLSFGDLMGGVGGVVKGVQNVIGEAGALATQLPNGINLVQGKIKELGGQIATISTVLVNDLKAGIDTIPVVMDGIEFSALLIPPIAGGIEELRIRINEYMVANALNAPVLRDQDASMVLMIIFGVPGIAQGSLTTIYNQFTALFKETIPV